MIEKFTHMEEKVECKYCVDQLGYVAGQSLSACPIIGMDPCPLRPSWMDIFE